MFPSIVIFFFLHCRTFGLHLFLHGYAMLAHSSNLMELQSITVNAKSMPCNVSGDGLHNLQVCMNGLLFSGTEWGEPVAAWKQYCKSTFLNDRTISAVLIQQHIESNKSNLTVNILLWQKILDTFKWFTSLILHSLQMNNQHESTRVSHREACGIKACRSTAERPCSPRNTWATELHETCASRRQHTSCHIVYRENCCA